MFRLVRGKIEVKDAEKTTENKLRIPGFNFGECQVFQSIKT
jgi:hypothetical protein